MQNIKHTYIKEKVKDMAIKVAYTKKEKKYRTAN
jgi:hypothetical protein